MKFEKSLLAMAGTIAISATAIIGAPSAVGVPDEIMETEVAKANPGVSADVLKSLPEPLLNSDIQIDESYAPGMAIVYEDGSPVPGQRADLMDQARACGEGIVFGPGTGGWGPVSEGTCGVAGSPGFEATYGWTRAPESYTMGCVQVRGFNDQQERTWFNAGCGQSGANNAVPWGNVLGAAAAQAQSNAVPAGFTAKWSQG